MSINWVMLDRTGKRPFVPLPQERAVFASPARTSISLKSPKSTSSDEQTIDYSSSSGIAYITSRRLVYLPQPATAAFQSLSVPLLNLHDTYVTAPLFGPNAVCGAVQPVRDGGLPTPTAAPYMLELRLTFKDGGAYDFHSKFAETRERLVQAREMVREIGGNAAHQELHGEQLPAYEQYEGGGGGGGSASGEIPSSASVQVQGFPEAAAPPLPAQNAERSSSQPTDYTAPPDSPPPDYEEFQHSQR